MSNTANNTSGFFDLHVEGLGYLNRIRRVTPRKGSEFLACTIEALRGATDDVEKSRFDVRISGEVAKAAVLALESAVMVDKKSVLIGFKLGDIFAEHFVLEKGDRKGEVACVIKGRLLQVKWAKVDGSSFEIPLIEKPAKTGTNG
jgi:hypothetical protein